MPMTPIDGHENPFEKSRLFKAASAMRKPEEPPIQSKPAPQAVKSVTTWPARSDNELAISTRDILTLIQRYRLRSMTFQQLEALNLSQLTPEEKSFVLFMRRNPQVFERISGMDRDGSSLSEKDVKMASQLAGDALVLSTEDLRYLRRTPLPTPPRTRPDALSRNGGPQASQLQTQDLINTLNKLTPDGMQGVPFETLMAMAAATSGLRGRDLEGLRFLQTTTVSKVLQKVVAPYNGLVSPEVLRVLTSLLWNPSIYGSAPVVFFQSGPSHADAVEGIHQIDVVDPVDDYKHEQIRPTKQKPSFRLEAHHMHDILHNISDDGQATLEQLRQYQPQNLEEEKAINLLRQHNVFEALASLDHVPESLSDDDIRLALAEHAIVLSDPYMVLVILP